MMLGTVIHHLKRLVVDNDLELFPMGKSFSGYSGKRFLADLRAGLNVALLAIPQGMAYASLAGLPIYYGITCSIVAAIIAPILSGSNYTVLGPTNATAFLVYSTLMANAVMLGGEEAVWAMMPLLVFLVGLILVVGAFLRIADLVQYISRSVVVGYITGAAVLIIANQLKHVLGIEFDSPSQGRTFIGVVTGMAEKYREVDWEPFLVGALTAATYFGLRRFIKRLAFPMTLLGITLLTMFLSNALPNGFDVPDFRNQHFDLGDLIPSMPSLGDGNVFDIISLLFGTALGVAFLASLETSAMSKSLASRTGERTNLNQDMLSLGVVNMAGAFLSGMPASGSLTRSALNFASGAVTRLSSVISGVFCLIGAILLGPFVEYIPKACLAALVICVAITLISRRSIRICLNATG
ncbi:MAG: SulP family inorganic anion transporter, partial [Verrucomicrobiales bacterium]